MKKVLAFLIIVVLLFSLAACGAEKTANDVTTTAITTTATNGTTTEVLNGLLAIKADLIYEANFYQQVVEFIKNEWPTLKGGSISIWELDKEYELLLDHYERSLTLRKEGWEKKVCYNVDCPRIDGVQKKPIGELTMLKSYTEDVIEIWSFGKKVADLPKGLSFDITVIDANKERAVVRESDSIGLINLIDFKYTGIANNCAGPVVTEDDSVWYIDKDANLIHINLDSLETKKLAEGVVTIEMLGEWHFAWREKGSLQWKMPDFWVKDGKVLPYEEIHSGR